MLKTATDGSILNLFNNVASAENVI